MITIQKSEPLFINAFEVPFDDFYINAFGPVEKTIYIIRQASHKCLDKAVFFLVDSWGNILPNPKSFYQEHLKQMFIYYYHHGCEYVDCGKNFTVAFQKKVTRQGMVLLPRDIGPREFTFYPN